MRSLWCHLLGSKRYLRDRWRPLPMMWRSAGLWKRHASTGWRFSGPRGPRVCDNSRMRHLEAAPTVLRARQVLGLNQTELAELLGASRRTGQRWAAGQSTMHPIELRALAGHVFPKDAKLAAKLAWYADTTLEELGLVAPVPPPKPFYPSREHLLDSVLCAAAEAVGMTPGAMRPALRAAVARAKELELSVDTMHATLSTVAEPRAAG